MPDGKSTDEVAYRQVVASGLSRRVELRRGVQRRLRRSL